MKKVTSKDITIVTPTFNRAHTLQRVYKSLLKQKVPLDFNWLIIDDGSTDNTMEYINELIKENKIKIRYKYKKNGGKASALNFSFDYLNTKYFTILDSDDFLSDKGLLEVLKELNEIDSNENISGLYALRTNLDGTVFGGKKIPEKTKYIKPIDIPQKYKINSESIVFYKTKYVKNKIRFPSFEGENFVSPAYLDYEITKKNVFKVSDKVICYCEYLDDGLTKNKTKIIVNNPQGYRLIKKMTLEQANKPIFTIKRTIAYISGSILAGNKNVISDSPKKILTFLLYPLGYVYYFIRFKRSEKNEKK